MQASVVAGQEINAILCQSPPPHPRQGTLTDLIGQVHSNTCNFEIDFAVNLIYGRMDL